MSTGSASTSTSPNTAPIRPNQNQCAKCRVTIAKAADTLTCFMCQRRIHVRCINNVNLTDKEVENIRNGQSPLHFSCFICEDRVIRNSENNHLFEAEQLIKENSKKANSLIKQLKAELQDLNDQMNIQSKELQDTKRENQLIEQRIAMLAEKTRDTKKRRINFNETSPNATIHSASRMDTDSETDANQQFHTLQANVYRALQAAEKKMEKQLSNAISNLNSTIVDSIQKALAAHIPPSTSYTENQNQFAPPQIRPSRATSRERTPVNANRSGQRTTASGLSYAAALSRSASKPDTIRNIRAIGDENEMIRTMQQLQLDNICKQNIIKSVKNKGAFNLTIKCATADDASKVESLLTEKYGSKIEVNEVLQQQPQIKITGVITGVWRPH